MGEYAPPFSVSAKAIRLVADISALVERYAIRPEAADGLLLRKANRIKTIRSSLAIEGNELTEMKKKGILLRIGARRNGEWKVLIPATQV